MEDTIIDYNKLIDKAMHQVVRESLSYAQKGELPGEHHFYITFFTKFEGVKISESLQESFPDHMTIVVQHQFENLIVAEEKFSLSLYFSGIRERIEVPYNAIIAFQDPSVNFSLKFRHEKEEARKNIEVKKTPLKKVSGKVLSLADFKNKKK